MRTEWMQAHMDQTWTYDTSLYELNLDLIWAVIFILCTLAILYCLNEIRKRLAVIKQVRRRNFFRRETDENNRRGFAGHVRRYHNSPM